MAEDVKIYVSETVERVEIKVSDPFPTNVLPTGTLEINDVKANTLVSDVDGGSIPAEIYSWFKDKFALLVDKLLSSWVHGLIFITKAIDEALTSLQSTVSEHATSLEVIDGRLDAIDDKLIVNYVVPVDTAAVIIDKDKHGNPLNLSGEFEISRLSSFGNNINSTGVASIFINDITGNIFKQSYENGVLNAVNARGGAYYSHSRFDIIVNNGIMSWHLKYWLTDGELNYPTIYNAAGHSIKSSQIINSITKLEFKDSASGIYKLIRAGTVITIRRK